MKTRQQLLIDLYIAKPVAYLMNFLVRIAGKLLTIDHSLDREFKRIVVCKLKGMGSIIQATPMLAALRHRYPDAKITFVSTSANAGILRKVSHIDDIILINDKSMVKLTGSLLQALWRLICLRPDVYIDLEIYSNFSTLVTTFSLARNRIGYYLRSSSFRMGIYTHMMFFNSRVPVSESYLQIARLFGALKQPVTLYPLYQDIALPHYPLPARGYIVINPNASDLRIERRWGAERFHNLIRQCAARYPERQIVLIGSPAERAYTEEVAEGLESAQVLNLAGRTTMDELILLIRNAALVITNDTGPMHIAFACDAPTICLFGPCSPEQYGGFGNVCILYKRVYCSPCVHDFSIPPCKGNNTCMQLIPVQEVMDVVIAHLEHHIPLGDITGTTATFYQSDKQVLGLVNRVHNT